MGAPPPLGSRREWCIGGSQPSTWPARASMMVLISGVDSQRFEAGSCTGCTLIRMGSPSPRRLGNAGARPGPGRGSRTKRSPARVGVLPLQRPDLVRLFPSDSGRRGRAARSISPNARVARPGTLRAVGPGCPGARPAPGPPRTRTDRWRIPPSTSVSLSATATETAPSPASTSTSSRGGYWRGLDRHEMIPGPNIQGATETNPAQVAT